MRSKICTIESITDYFNDLDITTDLAENQIYKAFTTFFKKHNHNPDDHICEILANIYEVATFKKIIDNKYFHTLELCDDIDEYLFKIFISANKEGNEDICDYLLDNNYFVISNPFVFWDTHYYQKIKEKEEMQRILFGFNELLDNYVEVDTLKSYCEKNKNSITYFFNFFERHIVKKLGNKYDVTYNQPNQSDILADSQADDPDKFDYLLKENKFLEMCFEIIENVERYLIRVISRDDYIPPEDTYNIFIKDMPLNIQIIILSNMVHTFCEYSCTTGLDMLFFCEDNLLKNFISDPLFDFSNVLCSIFDDSEDSVADDYRITRNFINGMKNAYTLMFEKGFKIKDVSIFQNFMESVYIYDFNVYYDTVKKLRNHPLVHLYSNDILHAIHVGAPDIKIDDVKYLLGCCAIDYDDEMYYELIDRFLELKKINMVKYLIDISKHGYRLERNKRNKIVLKRNSRKDRLNFIAPINIAMDVQYTCSICLGTIKNEYRKLPCGHIFCKKCVDEWMIKNKNNTCPFCRSQVL